MKRLATKKEINLVKAIGRLTEAIDKGNWIGLEQLEYLKATRENLARNLQKIYEANNAKVTIHSKKAA